MRTRAEHLAWAKERALECIERNDVAGAVASMTSDLRKHPDFDNLATTMLCATGLYLRDVDEARRWVEGFN